MNAPNPTPLVAVDIGNTRIKFGFFADKSFSGRIPVPAHTLSLPVQDWNTQELAAWSTVAVGAPWWISSVNRTATSALCTWHEQHFGKSTAAQLRLLTHGDLPIAADVAEPGRVGLDRLAGAMAANQLRDSRRAAIVVDVGTAMKLNVVSAKGVFLGGAILPGFTMAAHALHQFTDLLPLVTVDELAVEPSALGKSTIDALRAGLYWGGVGALRQLVDQLKTTCGGEADVFLTGGDASKIDTHLVPPATYEPHLVLSGIALARPK